MGQWMAREAWDALVRGENCPVCPQMQSTAHFDETWFFVADLSFSRLFLQRNQFVKGYCVLVCMRHVSEPHLLEPDEQQRYWSDVVQVGRALELVFQPDKMNLNFLGNMVPHLHGHFLPRYLDDTAPHRPIDPNREVVILAEEEYRERIAQIRAALKF